MEAEKKRLEAAEKAAAEKEFLEKFERERRLGKDSSANSSQQESESDVENRKKRTLVSPHDKDEKKRLKTKPPEETEDEEDMDEEELGSDPLDNLGKILRKMRSFLSEPQIVKMIRKSCSLRFGKLIEEAQEEIIKAREQRVALETKCEERKTFAEDTLRKAVKEELKGSEGAVRPVSRGTFALAVGRKEIPKVTGVKGPVLPVPKLIVIRQENREGEDIRKRLKELVKPSEIGLKVKRLNLIRNGVIIEAESESGIEELLKSDALKKAGMTVEKPNKKKPVVMVYDINAALSDDEVKEEIFTRNMVESEISKEDFVKEFVLKHKYEAKDQRRGDAKRKHVVAECSVRVRNWLRRKGRVFVGWESCRIKDYVEVARCYKCQRFGHVAKHCADKKLSCSHCSDEHDFKDCKKKGGEGAKCTNCTREGRNDAKHPASWRGCPVYEKAVKRHNEQIDYGV